LSAGLKAVRQTLVRLIAHIEVTVDYPEHDVEEITGKQVYEGIKKAIGQLEDIAATFARGRILREGIKAVIVGRPNVGKSSLLNELAGKNRAIVTEMPGTTRDIIEEHVSIKGIPVSIWDTAGIRDTSDPIEKIGVELAEKAAENADLVIVMIDASRGIEEEDRAIIKKASGKKKIYLLNKTDLVDKNRLESLSQCLSDGKVLYTSVLLAKGIDRLEEEIAELFMEGSIGINSQVLLTNIRHKDLVDKALISLKNACASYEAAMPLDCITIDIKDAAEFLGEITGESVSEDVVHEIFSRFCIGK
jgi:tRNA modification GTPase